MIIITTSSRSSIYWLLPTYHMYHKYNTRSSKSNHFISFQNKFMSNFFRNWSFIHLSRFWPNKNHPNVFSGTEKRHLVQWNAWHLPSSPGRGKCWGKLQKTCCRKQGPRMWCERWSRKTMGKPWENGDLYGTSPFLMGKYEP